MSATVPALAVGFIGDSITHSHPTLGGVNPPTVVARNLTAQGLPVVAVEQGHDGAASADWLVESGDGYLAGARAAFAAAGVSLVHVMLGTNDAHAGALVSVAQYQANLRAICGTLVAAGCTPVLSYSPWVNTTGTTWNGGAWPWDATSQQRLLDFHAAIDALIDGATILRGDTQAYAYFQAHPEQLQEGVHPGLAGVDALAGLWSAALAPHVRARLGAANADWTPLPLGPNLAPAPGEAPQYRVRAGQVEYRGAVQVANGGIDASGWALTAGLAGLMPPQNQRFPLTVPVCGAYLAALAGNALALYGGGGVVPPGTVLGLAQVRYSLI